MITKKRLEELIKQKATIYDRSGCEIKLGDEFKIDEDEDDKEIILRDWKNIEYWCIEHLFESKEEAKWYKQTNAENIIHFNPPMWEKIKYRRFEGKGIGVFCYRFCCGKTKSFGEINVIEKKNINVIYYEVYNEHYFKYSKEGYEQAVEYARKLFLGEVEK